uniref:Plastid lipid-associated protein/fibrillin conserved domain-containing protein n=1 Tax=Pseudo-nitzschia australis TaxID=44445 RepID=A0A7S4AGD0_9STRA|mmetsp:Transcript_26914/g.59100  ORF Transcript_26914/g.59100 Transcript_26914/m.59100 type:complete len:205 (-) Transcript_26914:138-752(-)
MNHHLRGIIKLCSCIVFLSSVTSAFFLKNLTQNNKPSGLLLPELESLIAASESGLEKSYEEDVKEMMVEISKSRKGDQRKSLPGRWELIYTTEKEINFFKTSWPFAKVSGITQGLDLNNEKVVNNVIEFEGGGEFSVTGSTNVVDGDDEYDRVAFEFTSAKALVWGREISLPPTGAGWFDTMYCDGNLRLSRDSRGDWSVFRRT